MSVTRGIKAAHGKEGHGPIATTVNPGVYRAWRWNPHFTSPNPANPASTGGTRVFSYSSGATASSPKFLGCASRFNKQMYSDNLLVLPIEVPVIA